MARGKPEAKGSGKQTHVALLRGINVGGKNPLPMADLVEMFAGGQCSDVRTYIQSGNVIFRATPEVAGRIGVRITERIRERFGYELPGDRALGTRAGGGAAGATPSSAD